MPDIPVNKTTIHYRDDGPKGAPALVCSPSMFFDGEMYTAQAEAFKDSFRVIRYDNRGQGESARHPREELDMDTLAEDAAALIEALELGKVTFIGNSMGGFIGLRLAARRPDLLRSAVVMGTSADAEDPEQSQEMDEAGAELAANGMAPIVDQVLEAMMGTTTLTDPARAQVLEGVKRMLVSRTPEYADALWHISHREGILDELGKIEVPVTVIAGAEDATYPPEKSQQIAAGIPHARFELMERAGHVHALENPVAVNALLADHLAELGL
jgi:3-oxoadipate enol-lactonase